MVVQCPMWFATVGWAFTSHKTARCKGEGLKGALGFTQGCSQSAMMPPERTAWINVSLLLLFNLLLELPLDRLNPKLVGKGNDQRIPYSSASRDTDQSKEGWGAERQMGHAQHISQRLELHPREKEHWGQAFNPWYEDGGEIAIYANK